MTSCSRLSARSAGYTKSMEAYAPQTALVDVFKVISRANKYIDENLPGCSRRTRQSGRAWRLILYQPVEGSPCRR